MRTIRRLTAMVEVMRSMAKTRSDKRRFKTWHHQRHTGLYR